MADPIPYSSLMQVRTFEHEFLSRIHIERLREPSWVAMKWMVKHKVELIMKADNFSFITSKINLVNESSPPIVTE